MRTGARRRTFGVVVAAVVGAAALAGCDAPTDDARPAAPSTPRPSAPTASSDGGGVTGDRSAEASPEDSSSATPQRRERRADPRWVFFTDDRRLHASPWFAGRHRLMIPFGCTPAPFYEADPACPDGQGTHHGIDVAMPCGTPLLAGRPAEVLDNGSLGPAYGGNPVLLRVRGQDVVIGHTTRVFVGPGDTLERGERFALAGDSGAPDGCHLHFEVRPAGGSYLDAVDPRPLLELRPPSR